MIGILVNSAETKTIAVTPHSITINPPALDASICWLAEFPKPEQMGLVTTWAGMLARTFGIEAITADTAMAVVERLNDVIPEDLHIPGTGIRQALYSLVRFQDRLVNPFGTETDVLNIVDISPSSGIEAAMDTLSGLRLRDFALPLSLAKSKIISQKARGNRPGIYEIQTGSMRGVTKALSNKTFWATSEQVGVLRARGDITITGSIQILGDEQLVPLEVHPLVSPFDVLRRKVNRSNRALFDSLLLRFLLDIPSESGVNPYSILLRGQAWARTINKAEMLESSGIRITKMAYGQIVHEAEL